MFEKKKILLSTAYLAPIQYYSKFYLPGAVYIEKHENYIKQTYRNRCIIYGANGSVTLSIPVIRGSFHKTHILDLKIDYATRWQDMHFRSIESAYKSSPFFEFYIDDLIPFYQSKTKFLFDFNKKIHEVILNFLDIKQEILYTEEFVNPSLAGPWDYRMNINPKSDFEDPFFNCFEYTQVFKARHGFIPNLSIIDLLFNLGPGASGYLRSSVIKSV
jgi:hypothetical protein